MPIVEKTTVALQTTQPTTTSGRRASRVIGNASKSDAAKNRLTSRVMAAFMASTPTALSVKVKASTVTSKKETANPSPVLSADTVRLAELSGYPLNKLPRTLVEKQRAENKHQLRVRSFVTEAARDSVTLEEITRRTGWPLTKIRKHLADKSLLALQMSDSPRIPLWQFQGEHESMELLNGLFDVRQVLEANHISVLGQMRWLTKPSRELDTITPIDALRAGKIQSVLEAARGVQMGQ